MPVSTKKKTTLWKNLSPSLSTNVAESCAHKWSLYLSLRWVCGLAQFYSQLSTRCQCLWWSFCLNILYRHTCVIIRCVLLLAAVSGWYFQLHACANWIVSLHLSALKTVWARIHSCCSYVTNKLSSLLNYFCICVDFFFLEGGGYIKACVAAQR